MQRWLDLCYEEYWMPDLEAWAEKGNRSPAPGLITEVAHLAWFQFKNMNFAVKET